ncbi:GntT/GntP/DsdX family permease [Kineosporia corallincola]
MLAPVLAQSTEPVAGDARLVTAVVLGIATVVLLIALAKLHPFLALVLGSAVLGVSGGLGVADTVDSFTDGVGATAGTVGLLIALGNMIGALLADSGGADRIVDRVVGRVPASRLPWAMAGVAALIGLPLFFEIGVVLLVPVVLLVASRTGVPLLKVAIPALAGLSVLHGLVPPHPGPLAAVSALDADLGLTLLFGLVIAVPTVILAGPVFASLVSRSVVAEAPPELVPASGISDRNRTGDDERTAAGPGAGGSVVPGSDEDAGTPRRPGFWPAVATVLLPVVLMLVRAVGELTLDEGDAVREALEVAGEPLVALLAGTLVAMFTLGFATGMDRARVSGSVAGALPPIAAILLIVAAGGGFKQVLIDAGVGEVIAGAARDADLSPLLLGWLVAVGIRVATGSATVATITSAGIVAPLAATQSSPGVALLVLAIGSGSLFFSHVNDAGFWLVKEYLGLTVGQTLRTWSVMETLISVLGLAGVLLLAPVV